MKEKAATCQNGFILLMKIYSSLKTETLISVSANIHNFHFYGTDICIVADILGYTSYVIPFMVKHLSKGNLDDMELKNPLF